MRPGKEPIPVEQPLDHPIVSEESYAPIGPLVAPRIGQPPNYLRRLRSDGSSESLWLFGACRAWVVAAQDPHNDWSPDEWLDRETELFAPMREGGFNLLNQWMAPWEFGLVHHDPRNFGRTATSGTALSVWRLARGPRTNVTIRAAHWHSINC